MISQNLNGMRMVLLGAIILMLLVLCKVSFCKLPPALAGGYKFRKSVALAEPIRLKPLHLAYLTH